MYSGTTPADLEPDDTIDEGLGGSINALGLNCHCLVDSNVVCLFLSGRGGTIDEASNKVDDDVKVDRGLGGGVTGTEEGDNGF